MYTSSLCTQILHPPTLFFFCLSNIFLFTGFSFVIFASDRSLCCNWNFYVTRMWTGHGQRVKNTGQAMAEHDDICEFANREAKIGHIVDVFDDEDRSLQSFVSASAVISATVTVTSLLCQHFLLVIWSKLLLPCLFIRNGTSQNKNNFPLVVFFLVLLLVCVVCHSPSLIPDILHTSGSHIYPSKKSSLSCLALMDVL